MHCKWVSFVTVVLCQTNVNITQLHATNYNIFYYGMLQTLQFFKDPH